MYHLDNTSGVPEMPEPKETQTISTRWFGESQEQGGISWPGADWFNIMQAEMLNLLAAAGMQPEKHVFDQLSKAVPELSSAKVKEFMTAEDGYRWVGQVKSFAALNLLQPSFDGQRILLAGFNEGDSTGKGEFVAVFGMATPVSGQIAVVNPYWYWKRITKEIRLSDCGLQKSQRSDVTKQNEYIYDVTDELQAIIYYANINQLPLNADDYDTANPGFESEGYYITRSLHFERLVSADPVKDEYIYTGVRSMPGNLVLLIHSGAFTAWETPEGPFVITSRCAKLNGEGKLYHGTVNTSTRVERITIRDCSESNGGPGRLRPLSAILWMCLGFNYTQLSAYGFNGHGVRVFAYDGIAQSTRAEQCGNIDKFSIYSSTYPYADKADESNAITFQEVFAHNSFEKSWYIAGSKVNVDRFHDEALTCTIDNPPNTYGIERRNGYGYTSAYFSSIGGKLGSGTFSTFKNKAVQPVLTLGVISNSIGTISVGAARVSIIAGDPGPEGGVINTLSNIGGETRIVEGARVTINYSRSEVLLLLDPDSKIENGGAKTTVCAGRLEKFSAGDLITNTGADIDGGSCGDLTVNSNGESAVSIEKLRVRGNATVSSKTYRSFIKNCWVLGTLTGPDNNVFDLENCTVHNMALGNKTGMNVNVMGGVFDTAMISPGVYLNPCPSFNVSCGGFTAPTGSAAIGRTTTDPNTGITYRYVGNNVWKRIVPST